MSTEAPLLIVEDSEDHVLLLKFAFKKAEILDQHFAVNSGQDAISYLAGTERFSDWKQFPLPSIVFLDLNMPGMHGFEVLSWIRNQPHLKALRVVILTSSDLGQEITQGYELGANAFLTKPVNLETLVQMMRVVREHWLYFAKQPAISRLAAA